MSVFPEFGSSNVFDMSDFQRGVCEGSVARKDGLELITLIKPWLGERALQSVTVVGSDEGAFYVQTDSRAQDGALVRGVTKFDPLHRPENPAEASRFDAAIDVLGRAATHTKNFVPVSAEVASQKRSA